MKEFNLMFNVGMAKYVINYHDGKKFHNDGSRFFDILLFRNKRKFEKTIKTLLMDGYVEN